ncbi:MAG TPA: DNA polymerase III subunit delta [Thermodesulfobacteriota bacterium]|nr:DNA polymerase III subunit delta [Thermodesulfobacteriota bacterium]
MNADELLAELKKGKLRPFYYFGGPEKWLADEAIRGVEAKALDPATRDFNRQVLDGDAADAGEIVASLQSFPVRSPLRLVIVRRADSVIKKNPAPLLEYLKSPNPLSCAVFTGEKADQRTKFFQTLGEKGAVVLFYPPYERELPRWVRLRAEHLGVSIADAAIPLLLDRVGSGMLEIQGELEKLALGKRAGERIEEADVLAMTEDRRTEGPFGIAPAAARRDVARCLRLLGKNLQQGEAPVFLLSLLARHFRQIRRARDLEARGFSRKEVEAKLKIFPRAAREFWEEADQAGPALLERFWGMSLAADRELKISRSEKPLLLEELILRLLLEPAGEDRRRGGGPGRVRGFDQGGARRG